MNPSLDFWRGKRVFVTGHTGFKGSWLVLWLQRLGANVFGYSLPATTTPNLHSLLSSQPDQAQTLGDIRDRNALRQAMRRAKPEIVFHLAAQALVRASYAQPVETFETNVMGTTNVLDTARNHDSVRCVVVVTTDKVYRNLECIYPYREDDALGGHDPYSASKAACELVAASYRDAFLATRGVGVATARAGNVIGGGDWSDDRLIPDAVRAWRAGATLLIRRPQAVRPWQHVLEPLAGYLRLAEKLWDRPDLAGPYNFGPRTGDAITVAEVLRLAARSYGGGHWECPDQDAGPHEAGLLSLETARSKSVLDVGPRWINEERVRRALQWYRRLEDGANARALCESDIDAFEAVSMGRTTPQAEIRPRAVSRRRLPGRGRLGGGPRGTDRCRLFRGHRSRRAIRQCR